MTLRISFFALGIMLLNGMSLAASSMASGNAESIHQIHILPDTIVVKDTLNHTKDSLNGVADTSLVKAAKKHRKPVIDAPVTYASEDSFALNVDEKQLLLYDKASVNYKEIELKSQFVQFEMSQQVAYATGLPDTAGKVIGFPNFKQGNEVFDAQALNYNFKTKKAFIIALKSKQDGGFLHSDSTKRQANGDIDLKNGKYTTCDADHPHYYLALTKGISIPNDKIISGPAYMVLEDVPLPIGIPFGFFPNTKTGTSGVLIPTYGEEQRRGFFLRGGGYYLCLSDHWDAHLTGDVFSKGTWGFNVSSNYNWIYKFNGIFSVQWYKNVDGEPGLPNSSPASHDFSIVWSHAQDGKANPTSNFSASVNFSTNSYELNHSTDVVNAVNNTKSSSISFTKMWKYLPFNFSASFNHQQNSMTKSFDLTLPAMSFNVSTLYPFRGLNKSGRDKWFDNISLSYSSSLRNNIHTYDSLIFTQKMFKNMVNGFQHNIPLSINIKPINGFNIAPSFNYSGTAFTSKLVEHYVPSKIQYSRLDKRYPAPDSLVTDTIHGLYYAHAFYPALSISVNPKIYGMLLFKGERIQAIRHVITPFISFSYVPDLSRFLSSYQSTVYDTLHRLSNMAYIYGDRAKGMNRTYPMYSGEYSAPTQGSGQSANLSFSLRNTLEMKTKNPNDTTGTVKKISLLESFDFNTNYNIITDSWTNINFNTGTRMLNNHLDIRLGATIDPYTIDTAGAQTRQLEVYKNQRIGRITNASLNIGLNLTSSQGGKKKETKTGNDETIPNAGDQNDIEKQRQLNIQNDYVDFTIPWSMNISYTLTYSKPAFKSEIIQSVRISGDFSITPKWKIGTSTGYDFVAHKVTITSINIYRDLHCWEMRLSIVPFGPLQSYNFGINVKSSILHDLKYTKNKSWVDNF